MSEDLKKLNGILGQVTGIWDVDDPDFESAKPGLRLLPDGDLRRIVDSDHPIVETRRVRDLYRGRDLAERATIWKALTEFGALLSVEWLERGSYDDPFAKLEDHLKEREDG